MSPEVLALLAVACLAPTAEPVRPDPALDAAHAALRPGPVAASPAPAEVAAALAAAAPPRRGRR
ncbi:hypothetical protein [Methylorubrum sp. DB1722]|uniref:hypothetical protein n=1 Tax=Methylorubrum sp. DB1722 TaxID=2478916 RepID=UPI0018E3456F|nr:hypothetical protein [Methylorubrum sp. DB1722]MBI1689509.1 hypothetical protein [Methylorubrum sp. DB1722]